MIDLYCERTASGLLNEPLNFFSNLVFILAAMILWWHFRPHDKSGRFLIFLIFSIGVGSGLFHSFANRLSQAADVIPITVFILSYLFLFFKRILALSNRDSLYNVVFFMIFSGIIALLFYTPELLNKSQNYIGTGLYLAGLSLYAHRQKRGNWRYLYAATIAFFCALLMRIIDLHMCGMNPYGTHFLWHLFNGFCAFWAVCYLFDFRNHSEEIVSW